MIKKLLIITQLSLLVLCALSFQACRKGCTDPKTPTKKELLVGKKWRLTELRVDGLTTLLTMADQNRRREYFSGETYTITYTDDPQFIYNGRWGFQNNETLIIYDVNTAAQTTEEIRYISADLLVVRKIEVGSTKEYTYVPQL